MEALTARAASPVARLATRCEQALARNESIALVLALLLSAASMAYNALTRYIWFDECFTLFISRLPSLHQMLEAMPADSQPPLQYLLTHTSLRLLGETEFGLRLPEMMAYLAAGLVTWCIVRRHGSAGQALFSLACLLGCKINGIQSSTARPYGLLVFFTAFVFWCWQAASVRVDRRMLPLCGMTVGLAAAIFTHHLAVVNIGLFLLAGELVRLRTRRRFDSPMTAAILLGLSALIFTVPLSRQTQRLLGDPVLHAITFWGQSSLVNLRYYAWTVPLPLAVLFLVIGLLFGLYHVTDSSAKALSPVPTHEWVASATLTLVLPVQMLLSSFEHGYFFPKYAVNTSLGVAVIAAWALPRIGLLRDSAQSMVTLSAAAFFLYSAAALGLKELRQPVSTVHLAEQGVSPLLRQAPAGGPIVVANAWDFTADWLYASPELKQRLVYLYDVSWAVRQSDFVPELSLAADKSLLPVPMAEFSPFVAAHPHFLLLCSGLPRLNLAAVHVAQSGWRMTLIAQSGGDALYRVDSGSAAYMLDSRFPDE